MQLQQMIRQQWISVILVAIYAIDLSYWLPRWEDFGKWMGNLPYIGAYQEFIRICLVAVVLVLLGVLVAGYRRVGWEINLWLQLLFAVYLCLALLTTPVFFLPFHPWWEGMRWWDRMLISLGMAWLSWMAIGWEKREA